MPTWEWTLEDGRKVRGDGATQEEAWANYNFANPQRGDGRQDPAEHGRKFGDAVDVLHGVSQGLLDPIEGLTQLAEKSTGWHLAPESLRNWARDYRKRAQSTVGGQLGEVGGNIAGAMVPFGLAARAAGMAPRLAQGAAAASRWVRANPFWAGAAAGASQPVSSSDDYWRTKANQALIGGGAGWGLPALAGAAARTGNIPSHFSWHFPATSAALNVAPVVARAAGRAGQQLPPDAVGYVAGELEGQ